MNLWLWLRNEVTSIIWMFFFDSSYFRKSRLDCSHTVWAMWQSPCPIVGGQGLWHAANIYMDFLQPAWVWVSHWWAYFIDINISISSSVPINTSRLIRGSSPQLVLGSNSYSSFTTWRITFLVELTKDKTPWGQLQDISHGMLPYYSITNFYTTKISNSAYL